MEQNRIIAIDGPAASGKGTLARALARHFDYAHLDTGLIYRALAQMVRASGTASDDEASMLAMIDDLSAERFFSLLSRADYVDTLRTAAIGAAAAQIATIAKLREKMVMVQRQFAHHPPGAKSGAVLDGRDIGTIVCPDADVKLFVTATPEMRAERRFKELVARGEDVSLAAILKDINRRDALDLSRQAAPMRLAENAHLLDTTDLSIEEARARALNFVASDLVANNSD